jgi:PIN domain nuclease of toxin-antitoxin system
LNTLLDTHTFLWFFDDNEKLSQNAKDLILDKNNEIFISIASIWELAIKINKKKYSFDGGIIALMNMIKENGFTILHTIKINYIKILQDLPSYHNDPFDRMIVATAIFENMAIITADQDIKRYNVKTLW